MSDLDTRARRAGAAARTEAAARLDRFGSPALDTTRRGHRGGTLAVATGTVALLLIGLAVLLDLTPVPTIDAVAPPGDVDDPVAEDGVLPVPDEGEVLAAYLDDGRPVFVSHPVAGDVVVLDAEVPHIGSIHHLNAFCPSSRWFEDPWYGSRFTGWGDYTDGPSPTGMPAYPTTRSADGTSVRVTGPPQQPTDRGELRGEPQNPQGPACVDAVSLTEAIVLHRLPETLPELDGHEVPGDRWVWASLVLDSEDGRAVVCDADGTCPDEAPPVADLHEVDDEAFADRRPGPYLARADDGTVRLLAPADLTLTPWGR